MTQHTIILAHGILGFGSTSGLPSPVDYFNGVALHWRNQGHVVITPSVNPIGSVAERGGQLADVILHVPLQQQEKLHVIAHSMGGLDARHAITNIDGVATRVATLVTIGTPHRGSPVADAIAGRTGSLPIPIWLLHELAANPGLHDLTTDVAIKFDGATADVDGVTYIEVAGDASQAGNELLLFELAAAIGDLTEEINDGVVTRSSALRAGHRHLEDWPADHAGEIGWSLASPIPIKFELPLIPPPPHFAWYDEIVAML
jgi:triacylglycerol lipase